MPPTGKDDQPSMASGMLDMLELIGPIREAMKGLRTQLVADGWSAEVAEQIAAAVFVDILHKPFT